MVISNSKNGLKFNKNTLENKAVQITFTHTKYNIAQSTYLVHSVLEKLIKLVDRYGRTVIFRAEDTFDEELNPNRFLRIRILQ